MLIVGVCASPRKGQSSFVLMRAALEAAAEAVPGVRTELVELAGKDIHGCLACGACAKELKCSQADDFPALLPLLSDPDLGGFMMASPVYFGGMTAQTKAFLDRMVSLRRALDVGYVGAAPTVTAAANQGVQVTILAQVNGEGSSLVCGRDSALHNVADLKGRTVAVPGHATVQDFLLRRALAQSKLEPEAMNIMVVKPPEMIGVLRMGQIDAFIAWEPYPARAIEQEVGRALATSHDIWPGHPCCVLAVSGELADQRPEMAKSLVRAHRAATQFIKEHPQRAAEIAVANTGMDLPTVRRAMAGVTYDTHLSATHLREYVEHLARMGYIKVADADAFLARLLRGRKMVGE